MRLQDTFFKASNKKVESDHKDKFGFARFVSERPFRFATTLAHNPHHYTVRRSDAPSETQNHRNTSRLPESDWEFTEACRVSMELGKSENYFGKWYRYVEINGFKYWTMGCPPYVSTVLNRKRSFYPMPYDLIAEEYDEQYDNPESRGVDEEILHHIGSLEGKRVLDVGCGTGWLLDQYPNVVPEQYVGIEPSEGMLRKLISKHPTFWKRLIVAKFEDYYPLGKFDTVLMLHGVGAYQTEEDLQKLPMMLEPGGGFVVMTFNEHRLKKQIMREKFKFTEVLHDTRDYLALNSQEDHDISYHKLYKGRMR